MAASDDDLGADDVEVDGARQADRLLAARLGRPQRSRFAERDARSNSGQTTQRARARRDGAFPLVGGAAGLRGSQSQWASDPSSTASNMVIGLAGMMVEIACL